MRDVTNICSGVLTSMAIVIIRLRRKRKKEVSESKGGRMSLENDRQQTEMSKRVPKIKK